MANNQLDQIEHIVTVIFENRSFDHMLGFLYPKNGAPRGQPFEGLTGKEYNVDKSGMKYTVHKIPPGDAYRYQYLGTDPGEGFFNTNFQLFGTDHPGPDAKATNGGFVQNFESVIKDSRLKGRALPRAQPQNIMGIYTPELLPILSGLAQGYAVCDHWFCSVPTQTTPNRDFAGAATSQGRMDNTVGTCTAPSIFAQLAAKLGPDSWAMFGGYGTDPIPNTMFGTRREFADITDASPDHFGTYQTFKARAAVGQLPQYTFLEPNFGYHRGAGASQHPDLNVAVGERFLLDLYDTLRKSPLWPKTLLIITYDEHGGCYDHVAPPPASPPGLGYVGEYGFDFRRYGVRVPAVLVSPLIEAGTVFRAQQGVIDHTSILKTIETRWGLEPLTQRDAEAPCLGDVLTLATPRKDNPLEGVKAPSDEAVEVDPAPTELLRLLALQVAQLKIPGPHGSIDDSFEIPDLSSDEAIEAFIASRGLAWDDYLRSRGGGD